MTSTFSDITMGMFLQPSDKQFFSTLARVLRFGSYDLERIGI